MEHGAGLACFGPSTTIIRVPVNVGEPDIDPVRGASQIPELLAHMGRTSRAMGRVVPNWSQLCGWLSNSKPLPAQVGRGFAMVGVTGRYLKQWEPDWLRKVIAKIDAAPARRPSSTGSSTVRPRRLDRRLSPTTIAEMVNAYRGGTSTNQLCERYGLSKGGLLKILQEHGVQMRNQPMTEEEIDRAERLYGEGQSLNAVARTVGKAKGSVWKALRERGIDMR
ncbi:helix-turn-helix domain-containing protein [Nocardia aurantia]|nr:helix-turn-helix domain-containing protein [Nocardia aurantia]